MTCCYVPLEYTVLGGFQSTLEKELIVTAPGANVAPPGYCMLWVLTETPDFPGIMIPSQMAAYVNIT